MTISKKLYITAFYFTLSACAFVPERTMTFDEKCQTVKKHIKLKAHEIPLFTDSDEDFEHEAISTILMTPISAIVSGSIAVVGNTLYWLQEIGDCQKDKRGNSKN